MAKMLDAHSQQHSGSQSRQRGSINETPVKKKLSLETRDFTYNLQEKLTMGPLPSKNKMFRIIRNNIIHYTIRTKVGHKSIHQDERCSICVPLFHLLSAHTTAAHTLVLEQTSCSHKTFKDVPASASFSFIFVVSRTRTRIVRVEGANADR